MDEQTKSLLLFAVDMAVRNANKVRMVLKTNEDASDIVQRITSCKEELCELFAEIEILECE